MLRELSRDEIPARGLRAQIPLPLGPLPFARLRRGFPVPARAGKSLRSSSGLHFRRLRTCMSDWSKYRPVFILVPFAASRSGKRKRERNASGTQRNQSIGESSGGVNSRERRGRTTSECRMEFDKV